jgi:hypothetical protein
MSESLRSLRFQVVSAGNAEVRLEYLNLGQLDWRLTSQQYDLTQVLNTSNAKVRLEYLNLGQLDWRLTSQQYDLSQVLTMQS